MIGAHHCDGLKIVDWPQNVNFALYPFRTMASQLTITLQTMKFYAYHGHFEIEKKVGNHFTVDLQITIDPPRACQTDQLDDALDYQKLHRIVQQEMAITSNLLEHVVNRIALQIEASFPDIRGMKICLSKMNPPMGGEMEMVKVCLEK